MKYRKKPVVVDAVQFVPGTWPDGVEPPPPHERGMGYGYVETLEGRVRAEWGDWIITGVAGEKYPCKDSIFRATYEPVDEPEDQEPED